MKLYSSLRFSSCSTLNVSFSLSGCFFCSLRKKINDYIIQASWDQLVHLWSLQWACTWVWVNGDFFKYLVSHEQISQLTNEQIPCYLRHLIPSRKSLPSYLVLMASFGLKMTFGFQHIVLTGIFQIPIAEDRIIDFDDIPLKKLTSAKAKSKIHFWSYKLWKSAFQKTEYFSRAMQQRGKKRREKSNRVVEHGSQGDLIRPRPEELM